LFKATVVADKGTDMHEHQVCRRSWFAALIAGIAWVVGLEPSGVKAAQYWPTHNCPKCGTQVYRIYHYGPGPYPHHTHRHGNTFWYH
jgi:hypothetical protein